MYYISHNNKEKEKYMYRYMYMFNFVPSRNNHYKEQPEINNMVTLTNKGARNGMED